MKSINFFLPNSIRNGQTRSPAKSRINSRSPAKSRINSRSPAQSRINSRSPAQSRIKLPPLARKESHSPFLSTGTVKALTPLRSTLKLPPLARKESQSPTTALSMRKIEKSHHMKVLSRLKTRTMSSEPFVPLTPFAMMISTSLGKIATKKSASIAQKEH